MLIPEALASGAVIDLAAIDLSQINVFFDIAEPLSRLARFNGQTPGGLYSVAQHCVMGADALLAETGDARLALAFLIHDAHEAFIGDITTPTVNWLNHLSTASHPGLLPGALIREAKRRLDAAIERLAGFLPTTNRAGEEVPAIDAEMRAKVHDADLRMLNAERLAFLPHTLPDSIWHESVLKSASIEIKPHVWSPESAVNAWMSRWIAWHPANGNQAMMRRATAAGRARTAEQPA